MAGAGYSGTPLPQKLGIKPGARVLLSGAPAGFERALAPLPEGAEVARTARGKAPYDVILCFAADARALERRLVSALPRLSESGGLWVAWPKQASGVPTDLAEGAVRARGLATGLVDNKVCAVDEVWSGLRFVRRLADRKGPKGGARRP
jgi:hypothetical protein